MDQIEKFIRKLDKKSALRILQALTDVQVLKLSGYNVQKLQGFHELYRVRIGKIRIIFEKTGAIGVVISIHYRGDAYQNL